jgi:hypothetical protein
MRALSCGPLANRATFPHNSRVNHLGGFMSAVHLRKFSFVLFATVIAFASFVLPRAGYAYTAEEQQACQGDAFRLCSDAIPDVDRVTACMVKKKAQLSPGCAVYFRGGPAPGATTKAVSRKPRKAKKTKPAAT